MFISLMFPQIKDNMTYENSLRLAFKLNKGLILLVISIKRSETVT